MIHEYTNNPAVRSTKYAIRNTLFAGQNSCGYLNNYSIIQVFGKIISMLDEREAGRLAELFGALSDPSRVRIIAELTRGEMNVGSLAEAVGLSGSAVSHQLRSLRQLKLVRARKVGRQVYYALDDEHIADLYARGLDHVRHG
jgi:ArsR family transcriptional regulator